MALDSPIITLITGCSSGIGFELLKLFNKEPYRIVATALPESAEKLANDPVAQSDRIWIRKLDVSDFEKATTIVEETNSKWGPIDLLINNAGISYRSVIEDMTPEDEQKQIAVNYLGPMHLIRQCLPDMRRRKNGRIINVSSVGGMMAMPTMASYSASKFALEGATESLWYEMRPWNIKVTLVRPGFINSIAFQKVLYSSKRKSGASSSSYDSHYHCMTKFVEKLMTKSSSTSASVARRIFKTARMERPPLRVAGTRDAWFFYFIRRLLPRALYHKLLYISLPGRKEWGKKK